MQQSKRQLTVHVGHPDDVAHIERIRANMIRARETTGLTQRDIDRSMGRALDSGRRMENSSRDWPLWSLQHRMAAIAKLTHRPEFTVRPALTPDVELDGDWAHLAASATAVAESGVQLLIDAGRRELLTMKLIRRRLDLGLEAYQAADRCGLDRGMWRAGETSIEVELTVAGLQRRARALELVFTVSFGPKEWWM